MTLRQELQKKGIARHIIDRVTESIDEEDAARRVGEKKARRWSHLPYNEFRVKLGGFLQRRGFRYDTIETITNEIWHSMAEHVANNGDEFT